MDQFIAQILAETARMPNALEVNLEANGCWRIIDPLPSIYPTQSQQQSTSAQNDFLQMGVQHAITANESVPARGHKREHDCADASSGGVCLSMFLDCISLFVSFFLRSYSVFCHSGSLHLKFFKP